MQSTAELFESIMEQVWKGNLFYNSWYDANVTAPALGGLILRDWTEDDIYCCKWKFLDGSVAITEAATPQSTIGSGVIAIGHDTIPQTSTRTARQAIRNLRPGETLSFPSLTTKQLQNIVSHDLPAGTYQVRGQTVSRLELTTTEA